MDFPVLSWKIQGNSMKILVVKAVAVGKTYVTVNQNADGILCDYIHLEYYE